MQIKFDMDEDSDNTGVYEEDKEEVDPWEEEEEE